jgi:hypothetical protein
MDSLNDRLKAFLTVFLDEKKDKNDPLITDVAKVLLNDLQERKIVVKNYDIIRLRVDLETKHYEESKARDFKTLRGFRELGMEIFKNKLFEQNTEALQFGIKDNYEVKILKLRE